jgi:muramoyltetrapeptide carboxypeptidase
MEEGRRRPAAGEAGPALRRPLLLPPPLRPGDRIGIAAPGGPVRHPAIDRGMAYLEARGYRPVPADHLEARHGYLAGSDRDRLGDLNRMIADRTLRAIWFARGGYGTSRIIDGVDLRPLRRAPKALVGYSDLTVLHAAAYRNLRLSTFYGPHVAELGDPGRFDEGSLWGRLSGEEPPAAIHLPAGSVLRHGTAAGPLLGGCLSLLTALVATPYEAPWRGALVFWEEVGEEPYRIDRMLGHLRLAGRLQGIRGMLVGRPVGCEAQEPANALPLASIIETHLRGAKIPVVLDLPLGHGPGKMTLPLGRRVRLDTRAGVLRFD